MGRILLRLEVLAVVVVAICLAVLSGGQQPSLGGDYITGARPKPNGDGPSLYEQPHEPFHDVCISASASCCRWKKRSEEK